MAPGDSPNGGGVAAAAAASYGGDGGGGAVAVLAARTMELLLLLLLSLLSPIFLVALFFAVASPELLPLSLPLSACPVAKTVLPAGNST